MRWNCMGIDISYSASQVYRYWWYYFIPISIYDRVYKGQGNETNSVQGSTKECLEDNNPKFIK